MLKGYKIRLYPTKEQEKLIWEHIHASRFMWNYMLNVQQENYKNGGKFITDFSMHKMVTPLRKEEKYSWLQNVSIHMLQRTCSDLAEAYKYFFSGQNGYPKYKSKKNAKSAFPASSDNFYFKNNIVHIQKLGKIKYKSDFYFPYGKTCRYYNVRITFKRGKYILSFSKECESQAPKLNESFAGIDLGVKELAVVACNDKKYVFHNINKSKRIKNIQSRLCFYQRCAFRKYEYSKEKNKGQYVKTKNIKKIEKRISDLYARKANILDDYTHKVSKSIVSLLPSKITMENLNVKGMLKNRHLSKSIQEQAFYKFICKMKYKCEWNGIEFVLADRFFPSSKTCSNCGAIKKDLKLSERIFVCPECGFSIDRDYNAAINLMKYTV